MRMSSPAGGEASLLLTDRVLIQLRSRPQARTLGQERDCFMWVCVAWGGCMWHGKVVCGMVGLAKRERDGAPKPCRVMVVSSLGHKPVLFSPR